MPVLIRTLKINGLKVMFTDDKETNNFLLFVLMVSFAYIGRLLKTEEEIHTKAFIGEVMLAIASAFMFWHLGIMEGMEYSQVAFFGVGSALGYIHTGRFVTQKWRKHVG